MICKLITWGKDREESMRIMDRAFDEYVIQGVTHNIGFGKSILANEAYWTGNYSTAFIPDYYPKGFSGDPLEPSDYTLLAVSAHQVKIAMQNHGKDAAAECRASTFYITIDALHGNPELDFKVQQLSVNEFEVTNLATGSSEKHTVDDFKYEYHSLLSMKMNGQEKKLQFTKSDINGLNYTFNHGGNSVGMKIYDWTQYKYKQYMPTPVAFDFAKSVLSPMPGAMVEVMCKPGDLVVEGQSLCIIEAMKMQNVVKAEVEGTIKRVNIKAGDTVAVDELMIQFE